MSDNRRPTDPQTVGDYDYQPKLTPERQAQLKAFLADLERVHGPGSIIRIPVAAAPVEHWHHVPMCRNCGAKVGEDVDACPRCLDLAAPLLSALEPMTNEQRRDVFSLLWDRYCRECGRADPGCQCWNDD